MELISTLDHIEVNVSEFKIIAGKRSLCYLIFEDDE